MKVKESLLETEYTLKNDLDTGPRWPEWWRLKVALTFHSLPGASMSQQPTGSIHQFSSLPSDMDVRRAIPDCRGRLYVSDRRKQMIGAAGDVIYRQGKGKFKFLKVKGRLLIKWTRKPTPDEPIAIEDLLRLPFKLSPPTHLKRTLRYLRKLRR